jgi:hypothetical protein
MHGTFWPDNRPLLIVDAWGNALADPDGNQIGWDGLIYTDPTSTTTPPRTLVVSTQNRGRSSTVGRVEDTRGL